MNSGNKYKPTEPLKMIDNDFVNYNHDNHLALVKEHLPELATACDIEKTKDVIPILKQAEAIKQYCNKLILIPKINCLKEIDAFSQGIEKDILLGYPVGRFEIPERREYYFTSQYKIHLLGGSFKRILKLINEYDNHIYSLDTNFPSRVAQYGKICLATGTKIPHQLQVPSGDKYNYRCFEYSLNQFDKVLQYRQMSLF
jgi:hypothetical protein